MFFLTGEYEHDNREILFIGLTLNVSLIYVVKYIKKNFDTLLSQIYVQVALISFFLGVLYYISAEKSELPWYGQVSLLVFSVLLTLIAISQTYVFKEKLNNND